MGTLHIVATPIGHLEDVTLRALRVLREADWVLAEDTRRTRVLLDHFEIPQKPTSLHAHNEAGRIDRVLEALSLGAEAVVRQHADEARQVSPARRAEVELHTILFSCATIVSSSGNSPVSSLE